MRKIICDRCMEEIKGYPVRLAAGCVDRGAGDALAGEGYEKCWGQIEGRDFCPGCIRDVVRYALEMPGAGREPEKAAQGTAGAEGDAWEPDGSRQEDAQPKPRKPKKQVDLGRIMALCKAGWKVKDIADDMGISKAAVYAGIARLKEEGAI